MKPKIGIIVNPFSRRNIRTNCASIKKFGKIGGDEVDIRATKSLEELDDVAKEFKTKKYSYIGISGGDGTIHNVITRLINAYHPDPLPPILLLGDGTMNNIATSIGLRNKSEVILKEFLVRCKDPFSLRIVRRDTMKISNRYCFLFGFGLTTNFLQEVYSDDDKGMRKNIFVIGKTFGEVINSIALQNENNLSLLKPLKADVFIDSKKISFNNILVVIAGTVEVIGMGFKTIYRANDIPNKFHIIINGMKPIELVRVLQKLRIGKRVHHPMHVDQTVTKIVIKSSEKFDYTMDGDMYTADKTLTVQTGVPVNFVVID